MLKNGCLRYYRYDCGAECLSRFLSHLYSNSLSEHLSCCDGTLQLALELFVKSQFPFNHSLLLWTGGLRIWK